MHDGLFCHPTWKFETTENLLRSVEVCKRCLPEHSYQVNHLRKEISFNSVKDEETYAKSLQGSQRGCFN